MVVGSNEQEDINLKFTSLVKLIFIFLHFQHLQLDHIWTLKKTNENLQVGNIHVTRSMEYNSGVGADFWKFLPQLFTGSGSYVKMSNTWNILTKFLLHPFGSHPLKIEYGFEINILALKWWWKVQIKYFEITPWAKPFTNSLIYFIKGRIFG